MSKRGAKVQINQLNPDAHDDHDSDDDSVHESKIDRSLLEKREQVKKHTCIPLITKPKRPSERIARLHSGNSSTTSSPNPFAKLDFSNPSLNYSSLTPLNGSPLSFALQKSDQAQNHGGGQDEFHQYALHVKGLNVSFKKHVVQCLEQDSLVNLSSCFESYQKHFDDIQKLGQPLKKEPDALLLPTESTKSEQKTSLGSPPTKPIPLSSPMYQAQSQAKPDAKGQEADEPNVKTKTPAVFSFSAIHSNSDSTTALALAPTPTITPAPFNFSSDAFNFGSKSDQDKKIVVDNQSTPLTTAPKPFSFSFNDTKEATKSSHISSSPFSVALPATVTPLFSPIVSPSHLPDNSLASPKPATLSFPETSQSKPPTTMTSTPFSFATAPALTTPVITAPAATPTPAPAPATTVPPPSSFSFGLTQPTSSETLAPIAATTNSSDSVAKPAFSFGVSSDSTAKSAVPVAKTFGSPSVSSAFSFGAMAPASNSVGFGFSQPVSNAPSSSFAFGSTTFSSTLPGASVSSVAPTPFSFGSTTPFSFAPSTVVSESTKVSEDPQDESKGDDDGDEASEEAPPAPVEMDPYTQGPGEEGESTLFALRCKLYHFSTDVKKWVDLGIGSLRLNRLSDGMRKCRLLIRAQSGTDKILLNFILFAKMDPELVEKTNSVSFFGLNLQGKPAKYLIRVKSQALAKELYDKLQKFKSEQ